VTYPIDEWKAQLAASVHYQTTPLGPADLEARVTSGVARHRERLTDLTRLKEAGEALEQGVSQSLDSMTSEAPASGWARLPLIGRWFAAETKEEPLSESLWVRYEQALTHIRSLGHHIELMERDLAIMDNEVRAMNQEALGAAHDSARATSRVSALEALSIDVGAALEHPMLDATDRVALGGMRDEIASQTWNRKLEAERFRAAIEADGQLLEMQRALRRSMTELHRALSEIHQRGLEAMAGLTPHLATLASEAAARDLASETATSVEALRGTLTQVCGLAHDNAVYIEEHLDSVTERMRLLDENSAQRRQAQEEVERALALARGEIGDRVH
jgi:hypothetical protein